MKLHELGTANPNAKAYRKGRGKGSGNGKTGGRGHKGQKARSGGGVRVGFEGGQMPLYMRLPKIGFNNKNFKNDYAEVKISDIELRYNAGEVVNAETVLEKGITKKVVDGIVVLSNGTLTKSVTVQAAKVTKAAEEKIVAAGGKVEVL
ncbi:MAG: 50S ribosomal protein L15 [Clostridia bacterium]|nr:50S ribosomal protein L15 [Clostridia bacterium]